MLEVTWRPLNKTGKAKIWLATTNRFKKGGRDNYRLMKEVPVATGSTTIDVKGTASEFYKVVIDMPYNYLNRWVILNK
jgi:hypothetical protein